MSAKEFFEEQRLKSISLGNKYKRIANRLAAIRAVVFIISISVFVYFVNNREMQMALLTTLTLLIIFVLLVKRYNRIKFTKEHNEYLTEINNAEIARLQGDLTAIDGGLEFTEKEHGYLEDLDILGDHSVFQLLNRTSTYPGRELLAKRMLGNSQVQDLSYYQLGVRELTSKPELMQEYQALGRQVTAASSDFIKFNSWLTRPPEISGNRALNFWIYFLPALFFIGLALTTYFAITYYGLLPLIIVNLILLAKHNKYAMEVVESTSDSLNMLRSFVQHIELLESQNFFK